jgi:hypothetical protein
MGEEPNSIPKCRVIIACLAAREEELLKKASSAVPKKEK